MAATEWDWPTLQATPATVVEKMLLYLEAQAAVQAAASGKNKGGGGTLGSQQPT